MQDPHIADPGAEGGTQTTESQQIGQNLLRPSPRTTIAAIIISVFLMGAGMGLQGSAVALRPSLEDFPESVVGLIMSFNYVGLILGSLD